MSSELTRRILFGVIAAPVAIGIVLLGEWPLAALLAVVSALGAWEFFRIARGTNLSPLDNTGVAIAGLLPLLVHAKYLGLYNPDASVGVASLGVIVVLVLLAASIWSHGPAGRPLGGVAVTVLGVVYVGATLSFAYAIRYHEYAFAPAPMGSWNIPSGGLLLLLPLFATWASDTGAYAFGRMWGRNKLIPLVSPGKTIEGAIGGILASALVAWVYVTFMLAPYAHFGFRWKPVGVLAFGVLVSVAAQIGDLVESLFKREANVKDSSTILPGHGGILDRCDSLFFVLPVSYVVLGWLLVWAPS